MYRILTVCTGNICRSPAMEILLRARLDSSVVVSGAGTYGMPAWPVHPPMARLLEDDGLPVSGFASRRITPEMVRESDLILTATAAHRAEVLEVEPTALHRVLSLGELARLAETAMRDGKLVDLFVGATNDAERLAALIPVALKLRHAQPGTHDDDIPDPYRRGQEVYAACYAQIRGLVDQLIAALQ